MSSARFRALSSELLDEPDFQGWELDPAFLTSCDLSALLCRIEELEDELEEIHRARGPIKGGPPLEWDAWILDLPDGVFGDCLGPMDRDCRRPAGGARRQDDRLARGASRAREYAL